MRRKIILAIIFLCLVALVGYLVTNSNRANDLDVALKIQRVCVAQNEYQKSNGGKYGTFAELNKSGLLKEIMSDGELNGYKYQLTLKLAGYSLSVIPIPNESSKSNFQQMYVDEKSDSVKWKRVISANRDNKNEEGNFFDKGQPLLCK